MQISLPIHTINHYLVVHINTITCYLYVDEVNSINLLLALCPGFLAGPFGIRAGRALKSIADSRPKGLPGFGWATFRWASSNIDTFVPLV